MGWVRSQPTYSLLKEPQTITLIFHISSNADYHLRTALYPLSLSSICTWSFIVISHPLKQDMYFNSFSSFPSRFATTNFTSTISLSCFNSILSLPLTCSIFLSFTFCKVLVSIALSTTFYTIFIGVECFGFVSSLVGVKVAMMFC